MSDHLTLSALLAGILTFFLPCTLPLVPAFIGFISAVPSGTLTWGAPGAIRRRVMKNTLAYILGFSVIFILLGMVFGLGGGALLKYRLILSRIGGALVVLFGLMLLGIFRGRVARFFATERRWHFTSILAPGRAGSSFILGATFAFGWTPCIGPILGTILLFASNQATLVKGGLLLAVFSLGLAIPHFVVALLLGTALRAIHRITRATRILSVISGAFLILVGILCILNRMGWLLNAGFQWLRFLHYDALLNYM